MTTILLPLDGSALSERAIPFATMLARKAGQSLLLLRAVDTLAAPTDAAGKALMHEAQEALDSTAALLSEDGLTVTTRVLDQHPATAILDAAAEEDISLIVMSTHGRGGLGRFLYGSVTDMVLRHAPVPVLTVPPHGIPTWPANQPLKILVPLDGSELSRAALGPAVELADILGGTLVLASVAVLPGYGMYAEGYAFVDASAFEEVLAETEAYLESVAAELRTPTRAVEISASYGSPYIGVMEAARTLKVGLIVMATHGRSGMTRILLGSVATSAIRQTEVPILLVRPAAATPAPEEGVPPSTSPAEEPPAPTTQAETPSPEIEVSLTQEDLTLLIRTIGERFYDEPVDPARAQSMRTLLEKLRTARPR